MTPYEVARKYADAWVAGDAATVIASYADDIVLHWYGENPLAGEHAGKPAALAALGRLTAIAKRGTPEIHDVIANGDHAVVLVTEHWMDGDAPVELNRVLVYHVRGDQLAECWVYDQDQRLVDRILTGSNIT